MKKISLIFILILSLGFNAQAQFLKKLKEKINNATTGNTEATKSESTKDEEKISKVGKTFTIRGKEGNKNYEVADNAELLFEEPIHNGKMQYYFTNGKKQYVINVVTIDNSNNAIEIEKSFVNKTQIANVVQSYQYNDGKIIKIEFYLNGDGQLVRQKQDGYDGSMGMDKFILYANTAKKANELQSLLLGKDMNGSTLNTFAYVTGDGKVVKTSSKPFWSLRDGALYFESLQNEKSLRVTYFENNTDLANKTSSYLVKVTNIPSASIGNYNQVSIGEKDAYLPLSKPVTKIIYDNLKSPTTEEVSDKFKIATNGLNSGLTNEYCNIVIQQLPANQKDKFRTEIQQPTVATRLKAEQEAERRYQESKLNNATNNNSNNTSSSSSNSSPSKNKKEETKNNNSSSNAKAKNITIKVKNDTGEEVNVFNQGSGGNYRLQKNIITTIKMDEGDKLLEYNNGKKGRVLLVAEPSMDGKVQLISKL
jgi:hypothetical protein